jgi:hypothetical protein
MVDRTCARPGCTRRVPKRRRKYCSLRCQNRVSQSNWRERVRKAVEWQRYQEEMVGVEETT